MKSDKNEAIDLLEQSTNRDPRVSMYGCYSYDDSLGGVGIFHWFDSVGDMITAMTSYMPDLYEDESEMSLKLAPIVESLNESEVSSKLMEEINGVTKGVYQIAWWGEFDDLLSTESGWGREFRENFSGMSDRGGPTS